ncbi:MAG: hypothetical protein HQL31_05755 [Planctomycetes bacterium]|nr:hypothetical protein [Planctomycetota bacterium]
MWLSTKYGFFSIVCAHNDNGESHPNLMMVRARKEAHLEKLREFCPELGEIVHNKGTDYPCRIIAKRDVVIGMTTKLAADIDYNNFKNAAHDETPNDRDYLEFLHSVWGLGLHITPPNHR